MTVDVRTKEIYRLRPKHTASDLWKAIACEGIVVSVPVPALSEGRCTITWRLQPEDDGRHHDGHGRSKAPEARLQIHVQRCLVTSASESTVSLVEGKEIRMNKKTSLPVLFRVGSSEDFVVQDDNRSDRKLSRRKALAGSGHRLAHPEAVTAFVHVSNIARRSPGGL